jgi:hypothetical protein
MNRVKWKLSPTIVLTVLGLALIAVVGLLLVAGYGVYPNITPAVKTPVATSSTVNSATTYVTTGVSSQSNPPPASNPPPSPAPVSPPATGAEWCSGIGANACVPGAPFGPSPTPTPDQYCNWYNEYFGVSYGPSGQHCNAQSAMALLNLAAVHGPVVSVPWLTGLIVGLSLFLYGFYNFLGRPEKKTR